MIPPARLTPGRSAVGLPQPQRGAWIGAGAGKRRQAMAIAIGTSGWSYDHWEDVLYPHGTAQRDRLGHYVPHFRTVELNSSFYHWPADRTFASWFRRLP